MPDDLTIDAARLRPHLRPSTPALWREQARVLRDELRRSPDRVMPAKRAAVGTPGDLRGIPVVGARGVGGVSPGTQPERETLRRERAA